MRVIAFSCLLLVMTFTGLAWAEPSSTLRDAYDRGDYAEVFRIIRPFVEAGNPMAQMFLGGMYADGKGVTKDYVEAAKWFRRAAEQGYANAQATLGAIYGMGQGVSQDFGESAKWYRRAAEQGHVFSQMKVGLLYYQGEGVPRDFVFAYMWFNIASANSSGKDHAKAVEVRDLISGLMTSEQIAEAQRRSRNWKPVKWTKGSAAPSPAAADRGLNKSVEKVSFGTGFFISQSGLVLTNSHVVEECQQTTLRLEDKTFLARVLARDISNDLALLGSDLKSAPRGVLRSSIRLGEEIVVFGYPLSKILASSGNLTVGNVSALSGLRDDSRYLQISAPVQPGNSGGPVLDRQGNVVGIVVGKLDALKIVAAINDIPQNVNFAIKSAVAMNFLGAQNVATDQPEAGPPLSTAELAERAKTFTVQVECKHAEPSSRAGFGSSSLKSQDSVEAAQTPDAKPPTEWCTDKSLAWYCTPKREPTRGFHVIDPSDPYR